MDLAKATARRDEKHLSVGIWCPYIRGLAVFIIIRPRWVTLRYEGWHSTICAIPQLRSVMECTLQWNHNGVSNHQNLDCLFSRLFRRTSKKTSKLRGTGLCEGNPPVTGGFPSQRANDAEFFFMRWRHHDIALHRTLRRGLVYILHVSRLWHG